MYQLFSKLHRIDGPAIISDGGTQRWYQHCKLHSDGKREYWTNDKFMR